MEFANTGGWLNHGDMAMDSGAQFLAVAEHRSIPARSRYVGNHLHRARYQSVWAPACQEHFAGGPGGVGVVSLGGAPLAVPTFATPGFKEFCQLGRALRVTLPTGMGEVVRLFVVHRYNGADEDPEKLLLTDKLFRSPLLTPRLCVSVSLCLLLMISVLVLAYFLMVQRYTVGAMLVQSQKKETSVTWSCHLATQH